MTEKYNRTKRLIAIDDESKREEPENEDLYDCDILEPNEQFDIEAERIDFFLLNFKNFVYEEGLNIGDKLTFSDIYDFIF